MRSLLILVAALLVDYSSPTHSLGVSPEEMAEARRFSDAKFRGLTPTEIGPGGLLVLANHGPMQRNGRDGAPLKIANLDFSRGLFCHAPSRILVRLPGPGKEFTASVGIDARAGGGTVVFSVHVGDSERYRSGTVRFLEPPVAVKVALQDAEQLVLEIDDAGDGISFDQSVWADAKVTLADGRELWLGDMPFWRRPYATDPPFSFKLDGQPSSVLLKDWRVDRANSKLDEARTEHTVGYTDPKTGLVIRLIAIEYHNFPTVEWRVEFRNGGTADTPVLSEVLALDLGLERTSPEEFVLHYHVGGESGPQDFEPQRTVMEPKAEKKFTTWFGFPTATNLPFFNLESKDEGVLLGLGWPGAWAAQFSRDTGTGLRLTAGQELTHFKLHPGEEARTPLVAIQFWKGDRTHAQNVWRRWMVAHNLPRPGGKLPGPIFAGHFPALEGSNAKDVLEHIDRYVQESLKPDYWWIDAGWYPNKGRDWQELLGTWEVDTKRFPRGLRGVFDVAHAKGIRSIVWFEPERVQPDSWLYRNHPEWLLGPDGSTKLFNHGNSEAHAWLVDHIDRLITEQGIDLYRQDFACFARDLWDAADAPDRKGITENRYVVGYLRYLDELRRRHPEMLIDICAAGGKRLDLENLRRAVPLWRSDYTFEPIGTQSQTYGLAFWLPYFGTGTAADTTYVLRSNMCPATVGTWDMRRKDLNYGALRTWLSQWRQVAPDYYGDFYPLTPYRRDKDVWMAWQFDRPEAGTGMIQVFRREESPFVSARFRLRALTPDARYAVTDLDTGTTQKFLGRELIEKGLLVAIADCPGSALVKYSKSDP